jgi:Uma2 family endonuclease
MTLSVQPQPPTVQTPPLKSGDHLSAEEFERRFDATPELKKAELINGVVYMPPPVSDGMHAAPHFDMSGWLAMYRFATPGVEGGLEGTLRLDRRNRPQPDIYLRISPECGGQSKRDASGYVTAGPELVAEVAASSADYDLHEKLELYRANSVREYLVWRTYDKLIDWFELSDAGFVPMPKDPDGVFRSRIFPGLWLNADGLVTGDIDALLASAQAGLASPERATFRDRLRQIRSKVLPATP